MTRLASPAVAEWASLVLQEVGLTPTDADSVADNLAYAETRGTVSHGFIRLPTYVERIVAGGIKSAYKSRILWDSGALLALDADDGPGAATGTEAAGLAVSRARKSGIGCVLVRNANHFGAAAYYAEIMANEGAIGVVSCNTDRAVSAPGGGRAVLGTNPLAIALPLPTDERPILDMATSEVSYGKLLVAAETGEKIPLGWAVDGRGEPTTSAVEGLSGALLPAAGPKGFGLAFMLDALIAVGGAPVSPFVAALHGDPSSPQRLGQLFIAISTQDNPLTYDDAIRELVSEVLDSQLPGSPPVMYPGQPEQLKVKSNRGSFEASTELIHSLSQLAETYDIPLPADQQDGILRD